MSMTLKRVPGSSPLTRGAHENTALLALAAGLIPAHAGSTPWNAATRVAHPAHPRSRGEHLLVGTQAYDLLGSSPLTRGALLMPRRIWRLMGLIPAHAGSTSH